MVNFLFSFLLPFLVVIAGLALRGAMPFGNGSLLAIDAWGQYYPMLCAMKEAIKSGELFWSGKGLMGFNLWAQNAYYTNSVLWLPLYLLPDKLMIAGINILAAIRIGLAGLTCSIYLSGCTAKKKPRGVEAAGVLSSLRAVGVHAGFHQPVYVDGRGDMSAACHKGD